MYECMHIVVSQGQDLHAGLMQSLLPLNVCVHAAGNHKGDRGTGSARGECQAGHLKYNIHQIVIARM